MPGPDRPPPDVAEPWIQHGWPSRMNLVIRLCDYVGIIQGPYVTSLIITPVDILGHDRLERADSGRDRFLTCANSGFTRLKGCQGIQHDPAELHHRQVTGAQALIGAIGDGPHGHPHGDILIGETLDARKVAVFHGFTVLEKTVPVVA